ncbi:MAG: 5-formyltetrahydrofolate cyclo-ligase [Nitrospirae bacterium]|nr:5-formyltetrahydrofolate cyclo-ligase [Nitrospirota bacterium]
MANKEQIRKEMLARRAGLSLEEIRLKSRDIKVRLFNREEFRRAKVIHFYISFNHEVNTEEMIRGALEMGKKVVVPCRGTTAGGIGLSELKDFDRELKPDRFGLKEPFGSYIRPVDPGHLELMVVPGVAFDSSGNRIGYGKGFYDRLLSQKKRGFIEALAFDFQVIESVPSEGHDIKMDRIITESRTIEVIHQGESI